MYSRVVTLFEEVTKKLVIIVRILFLTYLKLKKNLKDKPHKKAAIMWKGSKTYGKEKIVSVMMNGLNMYAILPCNKAEK